MTKDEALKLALEALIECDLAFDECKDYPLTHDAVLSSITAIKEALAQPEQEPVAVVNGVYANRIEWKCTPKFFPADGTNLYTAPPQRTWVGLTDEEISRIWGSYFSRGFEFARAIEAALKEKNT